MNLAIYTFVLNILYIYIYIYICNDIEPLINIPILHSQSEKGLVIIIIIVVIRSLSMFWIFTRLTWGKKQTGIYF